MNAIREWQSRAFVKELIVANIGLGLDKELNSDKIAEHISRKEEDDDYNHLFC